MCPPGRLHSLVHVRFRRPRQELCLRLALYLSRYSPSPASQIASRYFQQVQFLFMCALQVPNSTRMLTLLNLLRIAQTLFHSRRFTLEPRGQTHRQTESSMCLSGKDWGWGGRDHNSGLKRLLHSPLAVDSVFSCTCLWSHRCCVNWLPTTSGVQ